MTPERLAEIKAHSQQQHRDRGHYHPYGDGGMTFARENGVLHEHNILKTTDDWPPVASDADLIAHAPTDLADLLAYTEALWARIARVEALTTYTSDDGTEYVHDHGPLDGYPECAACWAADIRAALTEGAGQ